MEQSPRKVVPFNSPGIYVRVLVIGFQIFLLNQRLRIQRTLFHRQAGQVRSESEW